MFSRKSFSRISLTRRVAMAAAVSLAFAGPALAAWPERPVTMIVPWSAGGGTDATARIVASLLEKELGKPVSVVNRTGGGGIVGHTEIANAKADGYTIGVVTTELSMYHWLGTSALNYDSYSLIALYNTDPQGVHVRKDGPATIKDLVEAIKAAPGKHKASGANQGGAAHLSFVGLLNAIGLKAQDAPWVPTDGSAPSLQLLTSKAIDIVTTTMPEAQTMVDAGEVKTLALMRPERDPAFPDVPTIKETLGVDWSLGAWRGVAGPKGMPEEVVEALSKAMAKVVKDPEFVKFMDARKFGIEYAGGPDFANYLKQMDERFGEAMKAAGLAKQ